MSEYKVLSKRMLRKKKKEFVQLEPQQTRFNPIAILLLAFALISEVYLITKYIHIEPSMFYSVILLFLGIVALIGMLFLNKGKILSSGLPFRDMKSSVFYILGYITLVASVFLMMAILRMSFRFAVETIDLYFYYLSASIIEEAFFRMFLISLMIKIFPNKWYGVILGILLSSVIFMFAHFSAYGHDPGLMWSMLIGGIIFSIYYLLFKDISLTMLGHLTINLLTLMVQLGTIPIIQVV